MGKGSGGCARPSLSMFGSSGASGCNPDRVMEVVRSMPFDDAYVVGGAIRSRHLGQPIKDVDIAICGETYESMAAVLKRYGVVSELTVADRPVGARVHSDWTGEGGIEFALARTEVSTGAGYHDFDIVPDPSLTIEQDLERRDFTVNAIAEHVHTGEVIDPFGGVQDCKDRVLRTVSPTSFRDDALRIIRGLVRISKDGFTADDDMVQQMRDHASSLRPDAPNKPVSGERIREEMDKLLAGDNVREALRLARDTGALQAAIPEFEASTGFDQQSKYHSLPVDEHIFLAATRASEWDAPSTVRFAALFHDLGKPESAWKGEDGRLHYYKKDGHRSHEDIGAEMADRIWTRLQGDNESRDIVRGLVKHHMYREDADCVARIEAGKLAKLERSARRWLVRTADVPPEQLLLLRRCDRAAKSETLEDGWDADLTAWEKIVESQRNQPLTRKALAINGNDLLAMGAKGRAIGVVQRELLKRVIDTPEHNRPEQLKHWAVKMVADAMKAQETATVDR